MLIKLTMVLFRAILFALGLQEVVCVCALCGHFDNDLSLGVDGLKHPLEFTDAKGTTCAELMVNLFKLEYNDPLCRSAYNRSHARCCHDPLLPSIRQDPAPLPPQFTVSGPFKRCELCVGGGYPTRSSTVINLLYVGVGSCPQYYEWGQRGWIQDNLCSPLQYFARDPCGCTVNVG